MAGRDLVRDSPESSVTEAIENYAKAIYALQRRADGGTVSTTDLAARLAVTPGSASAMLRRLEELGLAKRVPYRGVSLTTKGERVALEVLRHHHLLELYLAEELDVPWDRVHEEAEILEHVLSEDLEERIAAKLGHPSRDPHGDPIPDTDLQVEEEVTVSLDQLQTGAAGRLVRVSDSNPEMLRYLNDQGIRIGDRLEVVDRQPFGGPMTVRFEGVEHALGGALLRAMRVLAGQPG